MSTGWFRLTDGRISFRGQITRGPVDEWLRRDDGAALVARAQRDLRFTLFGRERAARRGLWKAAAAAVSDPSARHAIQLEAERYLALLAGLAYTDALPHVHLDLHRLVVVPRALVDNGIFSSLVSRLDQIPSTAALDRSMRLFLAASLVSEMDSALVGARPRVGRPVPTQEQWASVGLNVDVAWTLPFSAGLPERRGHFHLYEMPRMGLARRGRRRIAAAIADLDAAVAALSRSERVDIVGRIATSLA